MGVTVIIPEADLDHNLDQNSAYLMPLTAVFFIFAALIFVKKHKYKYKYKIMKMILPLTWITTQPESQPDASHCYCPPLHIFTRLDLKQRKLSPNLIQSYFKIVCASTTK